MRIKIGDRSQLYGPTSDPAQAAKTQRAVLAKLAQAGIQLQGASEVKGPDVWFTTEDPEPFKTIDLPELGPAQELDGYVYRSLIIPIRERRSRR